MIPHGQMDYRPPEENDLKSVIEQRNRYLIERDEAVAKLAEAKRLAFMALGLVGNAQSESASGVLSDICDL